VSGRSTTSPAAEAVSRRTRRVAAAMAATAATGFVLGRRRTRAAQAGQPAAAPSSRPRGPVTGAGSTGARSTAVTHSPRGGAPHPDSDAKVDSPTDMRPRSLKYAAKSALGEFTRDQCTDLAAGLTYFAVLALFPAFIALTSILGVVGQGDEAVDELLGILGDLGAGGVVDTIGPTLRDLATSGAAGIGLVLGLLGALWSASGYVGGFSRAMNRVYEVGEGRPVYKLRPAMLGLTALLVVMVALVLFGLVVSGPVAQSVGDLVGLGSAAVTVWGIVKWPVILLIVVVIVALLYYFTPNVRQPKFRWVSVGAIFAILVWVVASAAFGFYVAGFSSYDKTYGALGGVIAFLLWLWITNLALLFGAELDSELERGRELQSGLAAEDELQLPLRDDTQLHKTEKKEQKERAEGRRIRQTAGQ